MQSKRAYLQVLNGRFASKRVWLEEQTPLRVGQSSRADFALVDEKMAAVHFQVAWNGKTCAFNTIGGNRFVVNGQSVQQANDQENGTVILAGETSFLLRIVSRDLRAQLPPSTTTLRKVTTELSAARNEALSALQNETRLLGLFDAARDRRIRPLLEASGASYESLFDGQKGQSLAEVAPYLVDLSEQSELLDVLVHDGWGESWGIYLIGLRPFKEVRRRLRRSLMVQDATTNKKLYFRFYDPRVLRTFWPTCSTRQKSEIMGSEIQTFLLEGTRDEVLRIG